MFFDNCTYNPDCDKSPVEPFGFIDLVKAYENNAIPQGVSASETGYNNISDPSRIIGKPRDVFEAAHLERTLRDYKPSKSATPTEEKPA